VSSGSGEIRATMPGKLLQLIVTAGDIVAQKQAVATMESMKMESTLVAPVAGRVAEVRFKEGDLVEMGDVVAVIEPI
jgi:biotin carboxyl carrier protein